MSKDIRPTYAGSKSSAERLKRGIVYARILVSVTYSNNSRFQLFLINLNYSFRWENVLSKQNEVQEQAPNKLLLQEIKQLLHTYM